MLIKNIRSKLQKYYTDEDLKKWFDPLVLICPEFNFVQERSSCLVVKFPHQLFADWFTNQYRDSFENIIYSIFEHDLKIVYKYPGVLNGQGKENTKISNKNTIKSDFEENEAEEASFDNFIFNRKNQFPFAAAKKFSQGDSPNVFILFGESGCGKSHLLQSIYSEVRKNVPEKLIFFNRLTDLGTFFSNAFKNDKSPLLYFEKFKYVLLDELDIVEENPVLQEQLILLLEFAQNNPVNIAMGMSKKPSLFAPMNEKLRSLIESGLAIELKKPDLDVRRQYVEYLADKLNLKLKKDDVLALARMYSGFRQIHGALLKVSSFLILSPQAAEAKLADILQPNIDSRTKKLTPEKIINAVAQYFSLNPDDIIGKKRKQDIVFARHISMFLCRELLGAQLVHIGSCFSDRDHSSVLYSINKIKDLIISDKDTHNMVTEVKNILIK